MNKPFPFKTLLRILGAIVLLLALVAGVAGCAAKETPNVEGDLPGVKRFRTDSALKLIPVTLDDGTRCVIASYGSNGLALQCQFKNT